MVKDIVLWSVSPGDFSLNCLTGSVSLGKYLSLIFSSLKWEPYLEQRVTVNDMY